MTYGSVYLATANSGLAAVLTKTLENLKTFVPKSHVGLCSEGCLNSSPEFSPSAYLTDTSLSRLKRILGWGLVGGRYVDEIHEKRAWNHTFGGGVE